AIDQALDVPGEKRLEGDRPELDPRLGSGPSDTGGEEEGHHERDEAAGHGATGVGHSLPGSPRARRLPAGSRARPPRDPGRPGATRILIGHMRKVANR